MGRESAAECERVAYTTECRRVTKRGSGVLLKGEQLWSGNVD